MSSTLTFDGVWSNVVSYDTATFNAVRLTATQVGNITVQ